VFSFVPAATVTDAGTVTSGLVLASVTAAPPAGALRTSPTVPVEPLPPCTEYGLKPNPWSCVGTTVTTVVRLTGPVVAVIVTGVSAVAPASAVIVKVAVVAEAPTVTDAGTVRRAAFELVRVTVPPPVLPNVTVPVEYL
jgi:hypothetical protein